MGSVKARNGSSWAEAKAVKVWNGSSWVNRKAYHWNGSVWVDDSTKVFTYAATMTDSVCSGSFGGGWRTTNDYPYQGIWDGSPQNVGFAWFDNAQIQADLAGKAIERIEAYFYRMSGWGNAAAAGLHVWGTTWDASMRGSSVTTAQAIEDLWFETADALSLAVNTDGWGDIDIDVGNSLRDGVFKGIALYKDGATNNDYLACQAYGDAHPPQLRITCY